MVDRVGVGDFEDVVESGGGDVADNDHGDGVGGGCDAVDIIHISLLLLILLLMMVVIMLHAIYCEVVI